MIMPTMHAAARSTSSTTPRRTELRSVSARVTTDGSSADAGAFGTRTSVLVSSTADILMNGGVQTDNVSKGRGALSLGHLPDSPCMITKPAGVGNFIRPSFRVNSTLSFNKLRLTAAGAEGAPAAVNSSSSRLKIELTLTGDARAFETPGRALSFSA